MREASADAPGTDAPNASADAAGTDALNASGAASIDAAPAEVIVDLGVQVTSKRVVEPLRCVSVCRVVKADAAGVFAVGDALEVAGAGAALAKALKRGAHVLARATVARANDRGRRVVTVADYGGKYAAGPAAGDADAWTGAVPRGLEWMKPPDELPYATETPGIGGAIKAACGDFVVEELLDGEPDGVVHRGAYHHWLLLRRENLTTESCQRLLARAFGLDDFRDVGCCGRKDKVARATQWFSVPCYSPTLERVVDDAASLVPAPLEVLRAERCSRKLRRNGHAGNRFEVTVTDVKDVAAALETCARTAQALDTLGVPNYFGAQRFGNGCRTAARGFQLLSSLGAARGPERRRLKKRLANGFAESFAVAAFNAAVFNAFCAERLRDGTFAAFLEGDVCTRRNLAPGRRPASDDAFDAAALDADFAAGRCSYTGPLLGRALRSPDAGTAAAALEDRVLARCGVARETVALVAEGSRRAARLPAPGLSLAATPRGLVLAFSLPRGSYATSVVREFTKAPTPPPPADGDDDGIDVPPPPPPPRRGTSRAGFFASRAAAGKGRRLEKWLLHRVRGAADDDAPDDHGARRLRLRLRVHAELLLGRGASQA